MNDYAGLPPETLIFLGHLVQVLKPHAATLELDQELAEIRAEIIKPSGGPPCRA
jgi:hypothetical protein